MKTKSFLSLLALLFFATSFTAIAQDSAFSGSWQLDKEKTVLADDQLFLSKMDIKLKNDTLFTTRVYENSYGEQYPFEEKLSLDGKECKIVIYDMPRTSKASKSVNDGAIIIESVTTFYGNNGEEDLDAKETWKVSADSKILSLDFTNKMSGNETTGKNFYTKIK